MSKRNKNPYRNGSSYHNIMEFIRSEQIVTRTQLMEKFPPADVSVVLSPRDEKDAKGDPRGNYSARGEVYYMERLKKVKGEPQRFRLRWRKEPLERRTRSVNKIDKEIKSQKKTSQKKIIEQSENIPA